MSTRIQRFVASTLSAFAIPVLCFALPTFGMPVAEPVTQAPPAPCQSVETAPARSGLNNKADPVFYSFPTDPITSPPMYCTSIATPGTPVEAHASTAGVMY